MKKAQTEMIGIVMIIVLLAVIALVFLYFALKPEKGFEELRENIQVSNLLIAMMKTNLNGCDKDIKETIVEYYNNCRSGGFAASGRICGDKDCSYFETEAGKIISKSFDKYEFKVSVDNIDEIKIGSCISGLASNYIIYEDNKDFLVVLRSC